MDDFRKTSLAPLDPPVSQNMLQIFKKASCFYFVFICRLMMRNLQKKLGLKIDPHIPYRLRPLPLLSYLGRLRFLDLDLEMILCISPVFLTHLVSVAFMM